MILQFSWSAWESSIFLPGLRQVCRPTAGQLSWLHPLCPGPGAYSLLHFFFSFLLQARSGVALGTRTSWHLFLPSGTFCPSWEHALERADVWASSYACILQTAPQCPGLAAPSPAPRLAVSVGVTQASSFFARELKITPATRSALKLFCNCPCPHFHFLKHSIKLSC